MARYLIDTDVMIDVSRGNAAAANFVDSLDDIHHHRARTHRRRQDQLDADRMERNG
ncbi:MAG: hypothetical protein LAP87_09735 [Acidobacteriia bacterium]|nr:hypothetical protein [Terriglobia bacterium]